MLRRAVLVLARHPWSRADGRAKPVSHVARWTQRQFLAFDILFDLGGCNRVAITFVILDGILVNRRVNLLHIYNAGTGLRRVSVLHKIGDGDCRQQSNNRHYNHDFYQCEPRVPM